MDVALGGGGSQSIQGLGQIFVFVGVSLALVRLPVLRVAGALLQEVVVAHELAGGHLAERHKLGAISLAIALELLFMDEDAGQAAGLHLTFGAGVEGLLGGTHLANTQTHGVCFDFQS